MKKFIVLSIVLLMLAGFAITSSAMEVILWADQIVDVGTLTVEVIDTNLVVTYNITVPWELGDTHLYVGTVAPTKSAPGRFPYGPEDAVNGVYTIPLTDFGGVFSLYIAAQAEVTHLTEIDPDTDELREETAWADGTQIRLGKNWATYFDYEGVLEVTQDSGQNDINRGLDRPHINWEIDGLCIEFEFVNPTLYTFVFDYRVDGEEGETHDWSDIVISGGELQGEEIGLRYNWVVMAPGETEEVQVCAEEEVWVGMRLGAENDWYLDWIIFEAKW